MKRILCFFLALLLVAALPMTALADGDPGSGNIDNGGSGLGTGSSTDYWNSGDEGVRVTVVRASDHAVVTTSVDFSSKSPAIAIHFGKVSKVGYINGATLTPHTDTYKVIAPTQTMPKIISTSSGNANIEAIKKYFCSEYAVKMIAEEVGMDYEVLINGDYKLLLEPIAYMTFGGSKYAMSAHEAALYDEQLGGGLRSKMVSLSHKNLPLAMFLEVSDLGFPAWDGSRTTAATNVDIKNSLGLGIVRFQEKPEPPPEVGTYDYEYRVNTEVITAVTVSGGQSDPDRPVSVTFNIMDASYTVSNVYYPSGDSQLAWVRWTTPSTPQVVTIPVTVKGGGSVSDTTITANIVDLSGNDPPNPVADDRNDSFTPGTMPSNTQITSAQWGIWRPWWRAYWVWHSDYDDEGNDNGYWCDHGWWNFDYDRYSASLSASTTILPDDKVPTAYGKEMKSGYGIKQEVQARVSTTQSSATTGAQNAVTYFPEFHYQIYWRLLDRMQTGLNSGFEFKVNEYSTYKRRVHFTPIWMPDGSYPVYTWMIDCWTPVGMLSMNLTDSVTIHGALWDDWHVAPLSPD